VVYSSLRSSYNIGITYSFSKLKEQCAASFKAGSEPINRANGGSGKMRKNRFRNQNVNPLSPLSAFFLLLPAIQVALNPIE